MPYKDRKKQKEGTIKAFKKVDAGGGFYSVSGKGFTTKSLRKFIKALPGQPEEFYIYYQPQRA